MKKAELAHTPRMFCLILALWLFIESPFLTAVSQPIDASPTTKIHQIHARFSRGFAINLQDVIRQINPAVNDIIGSLGSKNFSIPSWVNYFVSASAGFNFTIENNFQIRPAVEDSGLFYPGTTTKLHLIIEPGPEYDENGYPTKPGSVSANASVKFGLNVPTASSLSSLSGFLQNSATIEIGRKFIPGIVVNYPEKDKIHCAGEEYGHHDVCDSVDKLYPPIWDITCCFNTRYRDVIDYGGWVPIILVNYPSFDPRNSYPLVGLGLGIAPDLQINGTLTGTITGPGTNEHFSIINSTELEIKVPTGESGNTAESVPLTIRDLKYIWTPSLVLKIFLWGMVFNAVEKRFYAKTVDIVRIPVQLPTQTVDVAAFTVLIPTFVLDKDPSRVSEIQIALIVIIVSSFIMAGLARRVRR